MSLIYRLFLFLMLFFVLSCSAFDADKNVKQTNKIGFFGAKIEFVCLNDDSDCSLPTLSQGEL